MCSFSKFFTVTKKNDKENKRKEKKEKYLETIQNYFTK